MLGPGELVLECWYEETCKLAANRASNIALAKAAGVDNRSEIATVSYHVEIEFNGFVIKQLPGDGQCSCAHGMLP
jgi:hypothetical protein